jgi:hypothetical protein
MINGMPSPALRRFLTDNTPHLIQLSGFNCMNVHCCFRCRDVLTGDAMHLL